MGNVNVEAIRFKARKLAPYFGTVIWSLRPVAIPGIGTFAVSDDGDFCYDPDVPWTFEEQVGVFIHELHHVVLFHAERRKGKSARTWNEACDMEINNALRRGSILLPKGALQPTDFGLPENQSAEFYYGAILQMKEEQRPQHPDHCEPGQGRCGSAAGDKEEFEPKPDPNGANGAAQGANGGNQGKPQGIGKSDVEMQTMRKRVAEEVMKDMGNAPGNLVEWAKSILNPTISWQAVLRASVKRAVQVVSGGASDYSYSRTNNRTLDPDLILPSLITKKPVVACIVDTSGSISRKELDEALAEVAGVIRSHANRMTVMAVDASVREVYTVGTAASLSGLKLSGGGGTDMREGIDYALKQVRPKPNIIIVFTDGMTPWPERDIPAQLIVCISKGGTDKRVPKWARVLKMGGK